MPGARITPSPPKTPTPPVNKPLIESPEERVRELHNIDEKLIRDVVTMNPSGSSPNASSTCGSYGPRQCTTVNSTGRNRSRYLGQRLKNYSRVDTATVGFFCPRPTCEYSQTAFALGTRPPVLAGLEPFHAAIAIIFAFNGLPSVVGLTAPLDRLPLTWRIKSMSLRCVGPEQLNQHRFPLRS